MTQPSEDRSAMRVRIVDVGSDEVTECSLGEFVAANEFDPEERYVIVSALETVGAFTMGGGAAPLVRIEAVKP